MKLIIVLLLLSQIGFSQNIVLDEDFKDNKNSWQIEYSDIKERAQISSGRYDLYTLDKQSWHYFTISKSFNDRANFAVESIITKLPREKEYLKINTQTAKQLLPQAGYNNKSNNRILEGLKIIEHQQSQGVRYNINPNGTYEYFYSPTTLNKELSEQLSYAMGYISKYPDQLAYNDELYGITWGGNANSNLFSFNVVPELKMFNVISIINGKWTTLIDWTKTDQLIARNATNKLRVSKVNDQYIFFINGNKVGQAPFQQFYGYNIGFFVGPETHISADNLVIETSESISVASSGIPKKEIPIQDSFTSSGTGFLISEKGYFVTNYHVVEQASEIWIETNILGKKQSVLAKVEVVDKANDLAILKVNELRSLPTPTFGFYPQTVDVGTSVFAMGYPLLSVLGDEIKITDGIVSSKTGFQGDISTYQISAPIQPGNSGGALFDKNGNLIGITSAGVRSAQNVGYAIKASYLQNLLDLVPERIETKLRNKIENLSFTDKIKELGRFVVIVKVK